MKILKDSSLYVAGEIVAKVFPFLLLPYLTRALGAEEYGQLSYLMTIVILVNIFISFIQFDAISRYFFYYGKNNLSIIIKSGNMLSLAIFLFILLFFLFSRNYIMMELSVISLLQSFMQVRVTILQCQKKVGNYIIAQLSSSVISTILTFIVFCLVQTSAEARMICIGIGYLFAALYAGRYINLKPQKNSYKKIKQCILYIFSFCWPLIFHHLAYYAKGQYDRIFISNIFDDKVLGIYSAGLQIALILPVLQMAIAKGMLPYYFEYIKKGKVTRRFILNSICIATVISLIPSLISFILPGSLYSFVLGIEYRDAKYYCVLFLFGYGINSGYLIISNYFFYFGKNKIIVIANMLSSLIYVIFLFYLGSESIKLIPYATVLSNVFLLFVVIILYFLLSEKLIKSEMVK